MYTHDINLLEYKRLIKNIYIGNTLCYINLITLFNLRHSTVTFMLESLYKKTIRLYKINQVLHFMFGVKLHLTPVPRAVTPDTSMINV